MCRTRTQKLDVNISNLDVHGMLNLLVHVGLVTVENTLLNKQHVEQRILNGADSRYATLTTGTLKRLAPSVVNITGRTRKGTVKSLAMHTERAWSEIQKSDEQRNETVGLESAEQQGPAQLLNGISSFGFTAQPVCAVELRKTSRRIMWCRWLLAEAIGHGTSNLYAVNAIQPRAHAGQQITGRTEGHSSAIYSWKGATKMEERAWRTEHGDRTAIERQILRTTVGSEVHGIAVGGSDDHDELGIYVETPNAVLGIREGDGHFTARTQPEGHRSGAGDVDLTLYSLRRFLALACTGHPTVLLPLFAPESDLLLVTQTGHELRALGPSLLSRQAGHRFLGYMQGQINRVQGQDKRHVPNRPELITRYGWDTKYASHALRLAIQGCEVVEHGTLTLPMPKARRRQVVAVKTGHVSKETALEWIQQYADRLRDLLDRGAGPLPDRPDLQMINDWSVQAHVREWGW